MGKQTKSRVIGRKINEVNYELYKKNIREERRKAGGCSKRYFRTLKYSA